MDLHQQMLLAAAASGQLWLRGGATDTPSAVVPSDHQHHPQQPQPVGAPPQLFGASLGSTAHIQPPGVTLRLPVGDQQQLSAGHFVAPPPVPSQAAIDQLVMAAAFQQMVERLRAAEHAQKSGGCVGVPSAQPQLQLSPPFAMPTASGAPSGASSATSSSSVVVPEKREEPPQRPQQHFVPRPSTSAAELLEHALARLVEQADGEDSNTEVSAEQTAAQFVATIAAPNTAAGGPSSTLLSGPDGEVLLCKVCSDKASGFHYGIFSCEGCKGFFRRSLQNKIDYRPCTQSQKCQIVRANRNRCQECRWRKCIEAGMSKDSVRYGRVPKREKEKLREEMRRDSARSAMEQLGAELSDDDTALGDQLERAFAELGAEWRHSLLGIDGAKEREEAEDEEKLNARRYLEQMRWVVRFAQRVPGFRLMRRDERIRLIKDAHFSVLLLRLCTMRAVTDRPEAQSPMVELGSVPRCMFVPASNGALREHLVEFVHRIREARPPVELCPSERQLALIAALCLCRAEGAGDAAAGALTSASQARYAPDESSSSGALQQAIARRIHDRLWDALNASLGSELLQFGPSLLRRDSLERQHLAALMEALRQMRIGHKQFLAATTCWNVPKELFVVAPPKVKEEPDRNGSATKKRRAEEGTEALKKDTQVGAVQVQQQLPQPTPQQEELPTLRRALERPPAIVSASAAPIPQQPSAASSLRELLERPPILRGQPRQQPAAEEQEQPLNLCVREMQ